MTYGKQPIWKLVQLCAQELTMNCKVPFTRGDLIRCVQRKNFCYGPDSINPIIQGITDNLRGGAPGAVGKDILHRVSRGLFVLKEENKGNDEQPLLSSSGRESDFGNLKKQKLSTSAKPHISEDGVDNVQIGKYNFRYICAIEPERQADGFIREYMPQVRYNNAAGLALNKYGDGPFCKFTIPRKMEIAGVYALIVKDAIRYIGECIRLSSRFNMGYGNIAPRNCFVGGQETNCRINNLVLQEIKDGLHISLWFFETNEYKSAERELRKSVFPIWNKI
jgi:hypothetical protein